MILVDYITTNAPTTIPGPGDLPCQKSEIALSNGPAPLKCTVPGLGSTGSHGFDFVSKSRGSWSILDTNTCSRLISPHTGKNVLKNVHYPLSSRVIIPANSSKTYEKQLVPKVLSGELPRRCTDGKKYFCGGGKVSPDHPPNLGFGWEWLKFC